MNFDFDLPIEPPADALRWQRHREQGVIPLWVADMDFRSPPCVVEALTARAALGAYGYPGDDEALRAAVVAWLAEQFDWHIAPEWLLWLPGVVPALHAVVRVLTTPAQAVMVPQPVYPHLKRSASEAGRQVCEIPLVLEHGRWVLPWTELDRLRLPQTRLVQFCNPQNPGGTVFRRDELERLAEFCCRHDLILCSDEIHAGLVLEPGLRHLPVASLGPEISRRTVTLMSLTKTFNFAGCSLAWAVVEDPALRQTLAGQLHTVLPGPSLFGPVATLAALRAGEPWRRALIDYLRANRDHLFARLGELPGVTCAGLEATYLAWLDCRALGHPDPAALFLRHGVALSPGSQFGQPGFVRVNLGTRRALLDQAIDRMAAALRSRP